MALRDFDQIRMENICAVVFRGEKGPQITAHYQAEKKRQTYKVQLKAEEIENFMTDVIECVVTTISKNEEDPFEKTTIYVAEGNPPSVFKLKKPELDAMSTPKEKQLAKDTLKVYGKANGVL